MTAVQTTTPEPATPSAKATTFEPKIVAFVCKWCTYAGADLAGTSRMTYAPNVRTIMLPCTGRIDVSFVLRAFLQGADGVIVSGCHPGDCHYTAGNYRARRRWMLFRDLLDAVGVDLKRFDLAWISAAEGAKWVKTISAFTDKIRNLGSYESMHKVAQDHMPAAAPSGVAFDTAGRVGLAPPQSAKPECGRASPTLLAAATEALSSGKVKAIVGWVKNSTLSRPRAIWLTRPEDAQRLVCPPAGCGNLARFLKNPMMRGVSPIAIVARQSEMLALNVLAQEAQLNPATILALTVGDNGQFLGLMDLNAAAEKLLVEQPEGRPMGFPDETLKALDELLAKNPEDRWAFWTEQSSRCIKCYACRGSCPMCNCDTCFADKNQPQWFPTAADGPGNLSWQIIRAFHLAGRCIGCGACQDACPSGIPLNIMGAAMARSALKNFGHRAGVDPKALPLQSDFKPDDEESFIL
jgi:coenzyme F420-reducing hydrogenase delta subunit/ferredoxin